MKNVPQTIHAATVVLLGVLFLIFVKAPSPEKEKSDYETSSKSVAMTRTPTFRAPPSKPTKAAKVIQTDQSPSKPLLRFRELKTKVLLDSGESAERERLLSDQRLVEWVTSKLTKVGTAIELKDRLPMIDFLEDATSWKENPNHTQVISAIADIILSDSFLRAPREEKRQFIGDKIELFTILSEQAPEEGLLLRSQVKDTKLESILDYASKRLPVDSIGKGNNQ